MLLPLERWDLALDEEDLEALAEHDLVPLFLPVVLFEVLLVAIFLFLLM